MDNVSNYPKKIQNLFKLVGCHGTNDDVINNYPNYLADSANHRNRQEKSVKSEDHFPKCVGVSPKILQRQDYPG